MPTIFQEKLVECSYCYAEVLEQKSIKIENNDEQVLCKQCAEMLLYEQEDIYSDEDYELR